MDFYLKIFKGQFDLARKDVQEKRVSDFDAQLFHYFLDAIHGKPAKLEMSADYQDLEEKKLLIALSKALSRKDYNMLIDLAETHPDNPIAQWLGGFAGLRSKNLRKAQEFYQRCVDLEPDNPLFAWSFGSFYLVVSPIQFHQIAKWYRKALEKGYPTDLVWIIRYLEIFEILQGSLMRALIFICIWLGLAALPPTRLIWSGLYIIVILLHIKTIVVTFKIRDINLLRWLVFRAIILTISAIALVYIWG